MKKNCAFAKVVILHKLSILIVRDAKRNTKKVVNLLVRAVMDIIQI